MPVRRGVGEEGEVGGGGGGEGGTGGVGLTKMTRRGVRYHLGRHTLTLPIVLSYDYIHVALVSVQLIKILYLTKEGCDFTEHPTPSIV